ncbi:MAG: DUF192 domain-containing protein [Anaerolineales bacterium]|nr:DUF192 domain-containing protein [Anaerolineales bacterium]
MTRTVTIQTPDKTIPDPIQACWCDSFACQLRGLMFRRRLDPREGLLFVYPRPSRIDTAIHMLFVFTDLAVFWIDSDNLVVDKVLARAWHLAYAPKRPARYILEVHPDRLGDLQIGEKVEFVHD